MKARQLDLTTPGNGGLPTPPACYVCGRDVKEVPIREQMEAQRAMCVPVWIASPGASAKHPAGLVRHSYCEPGTERWAKHLAPDDERGNMIARMYGLEGGAR